MSLGINRQKAQQQANNQALNLQPHPLHAQTAPKKPPRPNTCKPGEIDVSISIVGPNELLVRDHCTDTWAQKYVTVEGGVPEEHFTFMELKDIGAMLHDSPEFKTDKFKNQPGLITSLGRVLVQRDMKRADLVTAIHAIMREWYEVCKSDAHCILPQSIVALQDPNQRKLNDRIQELQNALSWTITERAFATVPTNNERQNTLVDYAREQAALRKA